MTQKNSDQSVDQSVEASGTGSNNNTGDGIKNIFDPLIKYLGLIGVLSIVLSFIITWFTSVMASNRIGHHISPYTIFRNIVGTHFAIALVIIVLFVIVYTGWFGYMANTALSQPATTAKASNQPKKTLNLLIIYKNIPKFIQKIIFYTRKAWSAVSIEVGRIINCINIKFLWISVLILILLSLVAFWYLRYTYDGHQWVALPWKRNFIYTSILAIWLSNVFILVSRIIAKKLFLIAVSGILLALFDSIITIILLSSSGSTLYLCALLVIWGVATISLSAANVMLVITYQRKTKESKIYWWQCVQSIIFFWTAQVVSLLIAYSLVNDRVVVENKHFWPSIILLTFVLAMPLVGLLLGQIGDRSVIIAVFLVTSAFAFIMIIGIPQQLYIILLGYQKNQSLSLVVEGKQDIKCKAEDDYAIPNDGKIYFSCAQSHSKKTYYGELYIPNYPENLIEKGGGYLYSRIYCLYGEKKSGTSIGNVISHNHMLYCIKKWFSAE